MALSGTIKLPAIKLTFGGQIRTSRRMRVLPVEDECIVARDLQGRLTKLGYECTAIASSKSEAIKLAKSAKPDVVLMDIRLNGRPDGIEAAREMRKRFHIPVIYLTGHSDSETLEQATLTEPFGYILKPFDDRELVVAIEVAMHKHGIEKRLQESEDRLRLAQKAGHLGVFDWNLESGKVVLTEQLEEMFGVPAGSFEGTYDAWNECIHPDDRASARERFEQWVKSGKRDEHGEHRILGPGGSVRWIEWRGRLYHGKAGRAVRIVGASMDITERRRIENVLREKELDLERSNADLQAYTHTVSHDLKEPLRTISCGIGLIERSSAQWDEESRDNLSLVAAGARRMGQLIDGLLEFSRVGQNQRPRSAVDCNAVVQEVIASLAVAIKRTGARVSAGPLPVLQMWEGRLQQLFQNLIGNALKYSKPGVPPEVCISAKLEDDKWRFTVKDNGIGFDMREADKIFRVFKQLHPGEYEGLGIGLSICKRIVEVHGGRLTVESAPGEGAAFHFTVPVRSGLVKHAAAPSS